MQKEHALRRRLIGRGDGRQWQAVDVEGAIERDAEIAADRYQQQQQVEAPVRGVRGSLLPAFDARFVGGRTPCQTISEPRKHEEKDDDAEQLVRIEEGVRD